jgi:formylglycine-generating enzyme required for sulfatase activity
MGRPRSANVAWTGAVVLAALPPVAACSAIVGIHDLPVSPPDAAVADAAAPMDVVAPDGASGAGDANATDAAAPDDEARPEAGGPPDAPAEAQSDAHPPCPGGRGPAMVDVGPFCIDSTEVTNSQYHDFLLASPSTADQPAQCAWNTSYQPGNGWSYDPAIASYPIASVDWCDAYAYCRWAGKRMCGAIGGGPADINHSAAPTNEHYYACSAGNSRLYPYGDTPSPEACNVHLTDSAVLPVASLATCEGGFPGVFDLVGNVEEWQDACDGDAGKDDKCLNGLAAFDFGPMMPMVTACDFSDSDPRSDQAKETGIRCCYP